VRDFVRRGYRFFAAVADRPHYVGQGGRERGDRMTLALALLDGVRGELLLFAAVTTALLGLDDVLLDLIAAMVRRRDRAIDEAAPVPRLRFAIFVPAWREERVIGAMIAATLARYDHPAYRLYVGCYPNDPATAAAVAALSDERVRLVIGRSDGPTTKADCLNTLWRALRADTRFAADAVVLHDAEDLVHPAELRALEQAIATAALAQLPVVPLIDPRRSLVSGHYADEFAEAHARDLVVRQALGAALPLAGVGCAIRCEALALLGGDEDAPFAADSLTEDYELGLRLGALGRTGRFLRVRDADGTLVATRAYFPDTLRGAVRQKARWVGGIALAGWDRTGWSRGIAERWMRWRDRRSPLAAVALASGYASAVVEGISVLGHRWFGTSPPAPGNIVIWLLTLNAVLLGWRLLVRAGLTAASYGGAEGLRAIVRVPVANLVAVLSTWRALRLHVGALSGTPVRWEKTAHRFPDLP
jgi:bacteriophage N4 adsorption protein B